MKIKEIIEHAATLDSDDKAYDYLIQESGIISGFNFNNKFKRGFKFLNIKQGVPRRINIKRSSGSVFEITYFKFKRNFQRGNWKILQNEFKTYKRKKLIINK